MIFFPELGQESQESSCLRKGNPLASRVAQGGLRPLVELCVEAAGLCGRRRVMLARMDVAANANLRLLRFDDLAEGFTSITILGRTCNTRSRHLRSRVRHENVNVVRHSGKRLLEFQRGSFKRLEVAHPVVLRLMLRGIGGRRRRGRQRMRWLDGITDSMDMSL